MSALDALAVRNHSFADRGGHLGATVMPTLGLGIVTCLDPRVDPAAFLGLELGEAMVLRNAGGRVSDRVIADLSFTTFMAQLMSGGGTGIEIAVIHHTGCGTGFLADDDFRTSYSLHTGYDSIGLAAEAVSDPESTVKTDTRLLLTHPLLPDALRVSGHVYDLDAGLVRTVVATTVRGSLRPSSQNADAGPSHTGTATAGPATGGAA